MEHPRGRHRAQVLTCMHWLDPASMQRFSSKGLSLSKPQLICSNADDSPMTFDLGTKKATGVQLDIISQHVTELQQWRGWLLSTKKKNDNIVIYNCPSGIKEMTSCSAKRKKNKQCRCSHFPFWGTVYTCIFVNLRWASMFLGTSESLSSAPYHSPSPPSVCYRAVCFAWR